MWPKKRIRLRCSASLLRAFAWGSASTRSCAAYWSRSVTSPGRVRSTSAAAKLGARSAEGDQRSLKKVVRKTASLSYRTSSRPEPMECPFIVRVTILSLFSLDQLRNAAFVKPKTKAAGVRGKFGVGAFSRRAARPFRAFGAVRRKKYLSPA